MNVLIKRLCFGVFQFVIVVVVLFVLLRLMPGGPFDSEIVLLPETKALLEAKFLLDKPVWIQLQNYLFELARGNWGESYLLPGKKVSDLVLASLPHSVFLGAMALSLSVFLGIAGSVLVADRSRPKISKLFFYLMLAGGSVPTLVAGPLLIFLFSFYFDLLPPGLWQGPRYWVLPVAALALRPSCIVMRVVSSALIEKLSEDFITSARAKGVTEFQILFRHALKNSILPLLGIMGSLSAQILSGSFLVEMIFAVPGMAHYFVEAMTSRDYSVAIGLALVYSAILILAQMIFDFLSEVLDPRTREGEL